MFIATSTFVHFHSICGFSFHSNYVCTLLSKRFCWLSNENIIYDIEFSGARVTETKQKKRHNNNTAANTIILNVMQNKRTTKCRKIINRTACVCVCCCSVFCHMNFVFYSIKTNTLKMFNEIHLLSQEGTWHNRNNVLDRSNAERANELER